RAKTLYQLTPTTEQDQTTVAVVMRMWQRPLSFQQWLRRYTRVIQVVAKPLNVSGQVRTLRRDILTLHWVAFRQQFTQNPADIHDILEDHRLQQISPMRRVQRPVNVIRNQSINIFKIADLAILQFLQDSCSI